jgi:PAS domain S-box-containing protein
VSSVWNLAIKTMDEPYFETRKSGIAPIGDIPWGTSFCHFYQNRNDQLGVLVPYFKAGLKHNERCIWVSPRASTKDLYQALKTTLPDFQKCLDRHQIETIYLSQWYTRYRKPSETILNKLDDAVLNGFDGLRIVINPALTTKITKTRIDEEIDTVSRYNIIALFSYPRDRFDAVNLIKVMKDYQFALVRNADKLEVIESSEARIVKNALVRNEERSRYILSHMAEGFAYHRIVLDEGGTPCDYVFLEINDAFEKLVGLSAKEILGKRVTQVLPGIEKDPIDWIGKYGKVALTGEPAHFDSYSEVLKKWYSVSAFSTQKGFFTVTFTDITERKKAEEERHRLYEELQEAQRHTSADLEATARLQKLGSLFLQEGNLEAILIEVVDAAIAISSADFGNIQILDPESSDLKIVAHRGFPGWWLDYWDSVSRGNGACGTALERGERIIVEDVEQSPIFIGTPALEIQLKAGVRAVQSTPLISRSGKPLGMFSTHYKKPHRLDEHTLGLLDLLARQAADIIERSQSEKALRDSEERFRAIAETSLVLISVSRVSDGEILFINRAYTDAFGYKPDELIGRKGVDLYVEFADRATLVSTLNEQGFIKDYEVRVRKADGTPFWISASVLPINYAGESALLGASIDITDRKEAEAAVEESEKKFRIIADFTYDWEYWRTQDNKFAYMSPSCLRITGYNSQEFIDNPDLYLSIIHPDDRDRVAGHMKTDLHHPDQEELEFRIIRRDGEERWIGHLCQPVLDEKENIQGRRSSNRDITDRKRAEEEIKRTNAELEASNKELEAFAYSVSHDLRAPLRSMEGFSSALMEDYAEKLDEQGKKYLNYVQESSELMGQLIDDLLKLSRVTRADMNYEMVNLSGLGDTIVAELKRSEPNRKVEIKISPNINVFGDRNLLRLALENLLGNAWKFSSKCEVTSIEMGECNYNGKLTYFIRDNGVGFDMTYVDKLFKPFQRLHKASEFAGTGIGLATVQRIIRRHGGEVWAEGKVEEGATFYFTL